MGARQVGMGSTRVAGRWRHLAAALAGAGLALSAALPLAAATAPSASAATCPSPGGQPIGPAPDPAGAAWVVRGHGYGHNLGMSQYGAQGAARLGCTYRQILAAYYPGTTVAIQTMEDAVDVKLMVGGTSARVTATSAALPWYGPAGKTATQPKGSTWSVVLSGTSAFLRDSSNANVFSAPAGGLIRAYENSRVVRVRSYDGSTLVTDRTVRWDETRFVPAADGLASTQAIRTTASGQAVQKYLWGLGEVPSSWPTHALYAQITAARTYLARRFVSATGAYTVWATPRDQNYLGYPHEKEDADAGGHWKAAVDAIPGRVVVDSAARLIDAMYTSSHGGRSEDVRYVFGGSAATSYLVPVDDSRWDRASDDPNKAWTVGYSAASMASRFGFDSISSMSLAAPGTSARLSGLKVTGVDGGQVVSRTYDGWDARALLGVKSPGFTVARKIIDYGIAVSGDWDGDGRAEPGWFDAGVFTLDYPDGSRSTVSLGGPGDVPVVADWDGDGRDGIGVFHDGTWSIRNSLAGAGVVSTFTYGRAGDRPVAGRWTTASPAGIGVVRGTRWLMRSTPSRGSVTLAVTFTGSGQPLLGDWNGDGRATPGWMSSGAWSLSESIGHPRVDHRLTFGRAGDDALAADWDGNGTDTPGVARSASFFWRNDLRGGTPTGSAVFH